jgi:hypothetical protein
LLQCNGNIPVHLLVQPKSLRLRHKLERLCFVFWNSRRVLLAHFQKRGEYVNSASYCEVLLKLWDAIHRKRPGQVAGEILFHLDNVRPHTAWPTHENSRTTVGTSWTSTLQLKLGPKRLASIWST